MAGCEFLDKSANLEMKTIVVLSGLMFLFFLLGSVCNWWCLLRALPGKRKGSGLPLIPGILGAIALLIAPSGSELFHWHSFWWMPPFVDVGCVPWSVYCIYYFTIKRPGKHKN
jgi:hypothetical protein